jgi:hypothetical protein
MRRCGGCSPHDIAGAFDKGNRVNQFFTLGEVRVPWPRPRGHEVYKANMAMSEDLRGHGTLNVTAETSP